MSALSSQMESIRRENRQQIETLSDHWDDKFDEHEKKDVERHESVLELRQDVAQQQTMMGLLISPDGSSGAVPRLAMGQKELVGVLNKGKGVLWAIGVMNTMLLLLAAYLALKK